MHPVSRRYFCGPRSPIDGWARSGPRRSPTIWGTWPPNLSPPIGISHLVSHYHGGAGSIKEKEPGQSAVGDVDATMAGVRTVLRARTIGSRRLPVGIVDEGAVADKLHRVGYPGVVVPEGAARRPGRDHVIGRVLGEDVERAPVRGELRTAGRDRRCQEGAAVVVRSELLSRQVDHDQLGRCTVDAGGRALERCLLSFL